MDEETRAILLSVEKVLVRIADALDKLEVAHSIGPTVYRFTMPTGERALYNSDGILVERLPTVRVSQEEQDWTRVHGQPKAEK